MKRSASNAERITSATQRLVTERSGESMVVPRGDETGVRLREHTRALRAAPRPRETLLEELELFCPFESGINVHADEAQAESVVWAERFGLIESAAQRDKLERSRIARLEALVFHSAPRDVLQLAADWTTLFCLLDDHVEREALGAVDLSVRFHCWLQNLRGAQRSAADAAGRAFLDLRPRLLDLGGRPWFERFVRQVENIFCGFMWEQINRQKGLKPSQTAYRTMRVDTVGLRPQFVLGELAEGISLSAAQRALPELEQLELITSRAVGWANDIFTCPKELREGEVHNLVMILMDSERLSFADAIRRAAAAHDEEVRDFLAIQARLRSSAGTTRELSSYVEMLRGWIRGHLDWSYETGRYGRSLSHAG